MMFKMRNCYQGHILHVRIHSMYLVKWSEKKQREKNKTCQNNILYILSILVPNEGGPYRAYNDFYTITKEILIISYCTCTSQGTGCYLIRAASLCNYFAT